MESRMIVKRAILCAVVLMFIGSVAFAQDAAKDQVNCYTTWDDSYFYIAFKVDSPDVRATNDKPNVDLAGDDMVEFYIETDNKGSESITPACFAMAVSAAGGSRFKAGDESGELKMTSAYTFKYGATVQGTINNPEDIDTTYCVEMAVPWEMLNMKAPSMGKMVGFNVIIRRHSNPDDFISLSPRVKTDQDLLVPEKWVKMVYAAHTFIASTVSIEKILSTKYVVRSPLIDGIINAKEWNNNTSFALDLPMPEGFVYEAKFPVQRTVFARYTYWYQADPRKQAPVQNIRNENGSLDIREVPANGVGPWFSYDRVQWHKDELSNMALAGITVALPDYLAAASAGPGAADKGLDCMVAALDELRKEGKPYPVVGMYFDTSYLKSGSQPLLAVYGAIKDFFNRIPPQYRAYAPSAKPDAGRPAAIVCLAKAESAGVWSREFVDRCSERFDKDFGSPLIWMGDSGFASKADALDAVAGGSESRISLAWITADDSYDKQWNDAIAANPLWVVCDAWNDYSSGKCICPTEKLGISRVNITKNSVKRFVVDRDYSARFLRCDIPKVLAANQIVQAHVVIRNVGKTTWRAKSGHALGYRWYRNGRFFGESKIRRPLDKDVAPGDSVAMNIGIATVTAQGSPLIEGPCELHIELVRGTDGKWFSALGDTPMMIPVTIGASEEFGVTMLSSAAPNMVALGANYPISVKIRNDGTEALKSSNTKIECKLVRVMRSQPDEPAQEVDMPALRANLRKDLKPGEIVDVPMTLTLAPAAKKTLDLSNLDDDWTYQLSFDITSGSKRLSEAGGRTLNQTICVLDSDYGPRIVDTDLASTLPKGQTVDAMVVLRNTGVQPWNAKKTSLGYHWYDDEGVEVQWESETSPLASTLGPSVALVQPAKVKVPSKEGKYILVWDLNIDNKWLSTESLSRGGDMLVVPVEVSDQSAAAN